MKVEDLLERTDAEVQRIDEEQGIIYGVKILGRHSRNGRSYSDNALADSVRLAEDAEVNIDHPRVADQERSIVEGWGVLRKCRIGGDGCYGDLHYLKAHPQTTALLEKVKRFSNKIGLSIVAKGVVSRKNGKAIVERLEQMRSVDLVARPATNTSLFEGVAGPTASSENKPMKTVKELAGLLDKLAVSKEQIIEHAGAVELIEGQHDGMDVLKAAVDSVLAMDESAERKVELLKSLLNGPQVNPDGDPNMAVDKEKLMQPGETAPPDPEKELAAAESTPPAWAANLIESTNKITQRLNEIDRERVLAGVLAKHGIALIEIKEDKLELLSKQPDEKAMESLLESWPKWTITKAQHRFTGQVTPSNGSFQDMRKVCVREVAPTK